LSDTPPSRGASALHETVVQEPPISSRPKEGSASARRWRSARFVAPALGLVLGAGALAHPGAKKITPTPRSVSREVSTAEDLVSDAKATPSIWPIEPDVEVPNPAPEVKRSSSGRAPRPTKAPSAHEPRRPPPSPGPASAVPDCTIPYTVDGAGIRHPRTECL
jgi:hypothetical protein